MGCSDFVAVGNADELWDGEMESYELDGREILLVRLDGEYHAYDGRCPHQGTSLAEGTLDGDLLTCGGHEWAFNARTGQGVSPRTACLRRREVRIAEGRVLVSRKAVAPSPIPSLSRPLVVGVDQAGARRA
jgi:nitrite reductase/ring-hydroxylating ferredoxin subunit